MLPEGGKIMSLLDDHIWHAIEGIFPPPKPRRSRCPGRHPLENRRTLNGILYVLKTGIPWEALPVEMDYGSGVTCWRRLREWRQDGTWSKLLPLLLAQLRDAETFNWSRVHVTRNVSRTRKRKTPHTRRRMDRQRLRPIRLISRSRVVKESPASV
jgi:transposase